MTKETYLQDMYHPTKACKDCGSHDFKVYVHELPRSRKFVTKCKDCKKVVK